MLKASPGFSLVELMVAVAVLVALLVLAAPSVSEFLANSRIRTTAENLANAIRLARVEALKQNRPMQFVYNPATGWAIIDPSGPTTVASDPMSEASGVALAMTPSNATSVTYSGIGHYLSPNPDASAPIQRIGVSSATTSGSRPLQVVVDPALGVGVKVCDPDPRFTSSDPFACP